MSAENYFHSLDVARFHEVVHKIHETVAARCGRVELTRDGCDDVCVVISKCELEALERAVEILTECADYKSMCDEVARVAAATSVLTPLYAPPPVA
jgi:hypothetical protein